MAADTPSKRTSWNRHEWIQATGERLRATQQMGLIEQLQCKRCGRDFIDVFSTGDRKAVFVSILSFWILAPEVAERWSEACPGRHLESDDEDRNQRTVEIRPSLALSKIGTPTCRSFA